MPKQTRCRLTKLQRFATFGIHDLYLSFRKSWIGRGQHSEDRNESVRFGVRVTSGGRRSPCSAAVPAASYGTVPVPVRTMGPCLPLTFDRNRNELAIQAPLRFNCTSL